MENKNNSPVFDRKVNTAECSQCKVGYFSSARDQGKASPTFSIDARFVIKIPG